MYLPGFGSPELEQSQKVGQERVAANDHLHWLYAHAVAVCWDVV